ncbi:TetR/AcrR family transcriptional regulator [Streptomyces sp. NPDC058464]|uniref:TetR/AcrR family transcriptional regulator n=1 Tax=Streptomyces sp. NPDC058464 TaxID=3346511 RepID=UPI003666F02D
MTVQEARSRVGRPRMTADRQREMLAVVLEELREVGYEALTMEGVAQRARCSKATLYRQWGSKARMVAAALRDRKVEAPAITDNGSLRGDLLVMTAWLATAAEEEAGLVAALHHAALVDREVAATLRTALLGLGPARVEEIVDRAVERGELTHRSRTMEFLPQLLFSAVVARPLIEGTAADESHLARFVDEVLLPVLRQG